MLVAALSAAIVGENQKQKDSFVKISVVTVCFNSQATIADTVRSFLAQSHPDKEMLVIDGGSTDATLETVRAFNSPLIKITSERDRGAYDAMNKGLRDFSGDAVGILNSDDTFHDMGALARIAESLETSDIVYGDLDLVTDHQTKSVVRVWHAGPYGRFAYQLGWVPPHPTFYVRRAVVEKVGLFDLQYPIAADYDFMLRAMALNKFRISYIPAPLADFKIGGISTKGWRATLAGNIECLHIRRRRLGAPVIDLAFFLRFARRIFQMRRLGLYQTAPK